MLEQNDHTLIEPKGIEVDPSWRVPEILAPAGGVSQFYAALNSGADAVFLGLQTFNARARATNFSTDDLKQLVPVAHAYGMKVLVTVNILIKQQEIEQLFETLSAIEASGADAIIVQDLAVACIAKKYFPALRLHASTQLAVHNVTGVLEAAKFGFRRVVLARELTHQEIRKIRAAVPRDVAEIEAFCHGSLCYSYSGLCFFSGAEDARSGNRGECAYTCRQPYKIINEPGHGFLFSMRDLDTSPSLDLLIKAGVDTLKIEGRKKDAQYVATSVKLYRQTLNRIFKRETLRPNAPESAFAFIHDDKPVATDLEFAFKRQPTSLFLKSRYQENVIDLDNPTHKGLEIGTVLSLSGKNQITFRCQHPIELYDGIRITDSGKVFHSKPQDGVNIKTEVHQSIDRYENKHIEFSVRSIFVGGRSKVKATKGDIVTIAVPEHTRLPEKGALIFKVRSADLKSRIEKISQLPADVRLLGYDPLSLNVFCTDESGQLKLSIQCTSGSFTFDAATFNIPEAERPRNISKLREDLTGVLTVFGDSQLACNDLKVAGDDHWFVPKSALKKFKSNLGIILRNRIDELRSERIKLSNDLNKSQISTITKKNIQQQCERFIIKTDRKDTALAALTCDFGPASLNEIVFEPKRAFIGNDNVDQVIKELFEQCSSAGIVFRIAIPTVVRGWDEPLLSRWIKYAYSIGIKHYEVGNIGGPALAHQWTGGEDLDISADFTLYTLNTEAHASLRDLGLKSATLSVEDDLTNIAAQVEQLSEESLATTAVILYKDTPLFIAEACSLTALHNGCPTAAVCGYRTLEIENKEGERFFVAHESCKSIVYGKNAFAVTHLKESLKQLGFTTFRLDFLTRPYDQQTMTAIVKSAVAGEEIHSTHSANYNRTLL